MQRVQRTAHMSLHKIYELKTLSRYAFVVSAYLRIIVMLMPYAPTHVSQITIFLGDAEDMVCSVANPSFVE